MKDNFGLKTSFGLAGAGIGMGIMGEAFNSEGLKSAGGVATGMIPVAVNIGMGSYMIKQLKGLKEVK
jgi:hypothetical protein